MRLARSHLDVAKYKKVSTNIYKLFQDKNDTIKKNVKKQEECYTVIQESIYDYICKDSIRY